MTTAEVRQIFGVLRPRQVALIRELAARPQVDDSFLHRLHQPLVRDRLEAVGDVRLDHPAPAPEALIEDEL